MNEALKDQLGKLCYLTRRAFVAREAARNIREDYRKRVISRAVYLQVDSFIDLARRFKNVLVKQKLLLPAQRVDLEERIKRLDDDYRGSYESIRDKVAAHRQEEAIESIIDNWNEVNLLSVDVFVDDMAAILQSLEAPLSFKCQQPDIEAVKKCIDGLNNAKANTPQSAVVMSNDSLALTRPGTVGMIACHPDQEKAMALGSIIDFVDVLCDVASHMDHSQLLREVVWSLIIVDLFSFLDGLYDDGKHESLMTKWRNGNYKGLPLIEATYNGRDMALEATAREIRNKFAAHLDVNDNLDNLKKLVLGFDMKEFAIYAASHIDNFQKACLADIRTRMFNIRNIPLAGALGVQEVAVKKFDE